MRSTRRIYWRQLTVSEIGLDNDGHAAAWEKYAGACVGASLYHSLAWRDIIARSFGHTPRYLIAIDGADVLGILPLFEMRSRWFGHFLVSLPFVNYGGILAEGPEAGQALAEASVNLAGRLGASHVELRQASPSPRPEQGWTLREHKAALIVPLCQGAAKLWDALSSRLRGKVRKALKNGADFRTGGRELLDDFYRLYALNMRDLGTPVYTRVFFDHIMAKGQNARILMAARNGRPAAAAIAVSGGNCIELPWICQNYAESVHNMNEFLYWSAIEWAAAEGATELDLGRSTIGAGTYRFKLQWNPRVRQLYWYYWTRPGAPLPQLNPENPKYGLAVKVWKKLPLAVANSIGPWIVRNIP
jgi:serine/alanine adding enzyme